MYLTRPDTEALINLLIDQLANNYDLLTALFPDVDHVVLTKDSQPEPVLNTALLSMKIAGVVDILLAKEQRIDLDKERVDIVQFWIETRANITARSVDDN